MSLSAALVGALSAIVVVTLVHLSLKPKPRELHVQFREAEPREKVGENDSNHVY
jgi:hypothetical protein